MSKYDRLGTYLREQGRDAIPMTFAEIERVVGTKLPNSQKHQAWWSNSTSNNVMTQVWLDAGYKTEQVDTVAKRLVFRRSDMLSSHPRGVAEEAHTFDPAPPPVKQPARHPAIGALKGTFTIEPGWDLTRPALDPEELEEWEASLDRKADLIEVGMKDRKA